MKGLIVVNPFGVPKESIVQAERLTAELTKLGVGVTVVSDGYARWTLESDIVLSGLNADFAVFLDKDKYLSSAMEKSGIRLFNSHAAIRTCDDKGETYLSLSGKGIKMPETVFAPVCYSPSLPLDKAAVKRIGEKLGYPLIVKESYGSLGKGVHLAENEERLIAYAEEYKTVPHFYQRYLGSRVGTDVRIIVIGGKYLCAMERVNENDFRSNVSLGGKGRAINPPESFVKTAEKCAEIIALDYCGVDILYGNGGEPVVCEVNSNAFFSGIEKATGVNVAKAYAEHIVNSLSK